MMLNEIEPSDSETGGSGNSNDQNYLVGRNPILPSSVYLEEIGKIRDNFEKLKKEFTKAKKISSEEIKSTHKELADYKAKLIEVLAIFVALFTFVSFEIQIFKSHEISVFSVTGFTLILLGALTFFIILLSNTINSKNEKKLYIFLTSIIMILTGVAFIAFGSKMKDFFVGHYFYNKIEVDLNINKTNQNMLDLKDCLKKYQWLNPKCLES